MPRQMKPKVCVVPKCGRRRTKGEYCWGHNGLIERGLPLDTPIRARPPTQCSLDGCHDPVQAKGLCPLHYARLKRGVPLDSPFDSRPKGAYKNVKNAKTTYEARVAARQAPAPMCACGCGRPTEFSPTKNAYLKYFRGHYRGFKPYKEETWLREQYVVNQRTVDSIAEECGVNRSSVRKYMRKFGIEARPQSESLRLGGKVRGKNNPSWKGGTTPERQRLYKTPEWKALVLAVWTRDGFKCQRCGVGNVSRTNRLHAHHIGTWAEYPELRTDMNNLVTLCKNCHLWVHSNDNRHRRFLKKGSRRNKHDTPPQPRNTAPKSR
jgi:hypothetical protein